MQERAKVDQLIDVFNYTFSEFNTRLVKGEGEPVYLPKDTLTPYHRIAFAHGFFSSALHEIAHWCIAGAARRNIEDYGYWYCADGRNKAQQEAFESVEIKPQAIEWAFCLASGHKFSVSTDNLTGFQPNRVEFAEHVRSQAVRYLREGFPSRAQQFIFALHGAFNTPALCESHFFKAAT